MVGTRMRAALGGLAAAALAALAVPASAQVVANPTALTQFGNDLLNDGIFLRGHYVGEFAANPSGGNSQSARYAGQVDIGADFDMGKILGVGNSAIHLTFSQRHGQNLAATNIGSSVSVQEVYGGGQTWRLTQLWYEVSALRDAVHLKAGRTSPGEDFGVFSCTFQNLSFCGSQPGNVVGDYWYNWPIGQWGGRVRGDLRTARRAW